MNILMISFASKGKEGRINRCFSALNKTNVVFLIEVGKEFSENESTIQLTLKNANPMFRYIEFVCKVIRFANEFDFDIIYAHNYYSALPALLLSKLRKKYFIYDAHELYYPAGGKRFTLRDRLFYYLERLAIHNAKTVICTNEERALIMVGHYNLKIIPTVIRNISNSVIHTKFTKEAENGIFKIVYAGYLSEDRGLMDFIKTISNHKYKNRICFDIYGVGPLSTSLLDLVNSKEYSFLKFKGEYQYEFLNDILSKYHIGYIAYPNMGFNNIFCSPNKLFDYTICGVVVIAPFNYSLEKIITKYQIGCCNNDLDFAITNIISNYKIYIENIDNFVRIYRWEDEEVKLNKAIIACK